MRQSYYLRPRLTDRQREQLSRIASVKSDADNTYYPCSVRLVDGSVLPRVYVVSQHGYIREWGVYPEYDPHKSSISIENVVEITESPWRLPATLANELYRNGESCMGGVIFTVVFADGSRQAYLTGNMVDFINLPDGKAFADIITVLPHEGRNSPQLPGLDYVWCLFADDETERQQKLGLTEPLPRERLTLVDSLTLWWRKRQRKNS